MNQEKNEKSLPWSVRLERSEQRRWWERLAQVYNIFQTVSSQSNE